MRINPIIIPDINTALPLINETDFMTGYQQSVRAHRLGCAADRQGLHIKRSRREDQGPAANKTLTLVSTRANTVVLSGARNGCRLGLKGICRHLSRDRDGR
jgi:hypothetical protein